MNFEISHAVDDSDVAFVMRLDRKSTVCSMMSSRSTHYHKVGTNIDAFVNLPTVNYLLAGLQLCYVSSHPEKSKWFELLYDLDKYAFPAVGKQLTLWDLRYILRELIVPFGIVRGSEKQGGQDETGLSAATWPVNFVCNMVLDGHDRNVVNYWHYHDINAGDDLVFRLKPMPIPRGKSAYTLNHYYKRFVQHNFESYFQQNLGHRLATHVWQLVPDVFSLDYKPENDHVHDPPSGVVMPPGFEVPHDFVWQEHGYWHVARSQVMVRKYALKEYYNDDMANQLKVNHLDLTFEPAYCKVPGESRDPLSDRTVQRDVRAAILVAGGNARVAYDRRGVRPGMASDASQGAWAPQLRLEELVGGPMPSLPGQAAGRAAPAFGSDIAAAYGLLGPGAGRRAHAEASLGVQGGPEASWGFQGGTGAHVGAEEARAGLDLRGAYEPLEGGLVFSDEAGLSSGPGRELVLPGNAVEALVLPGGDGSGRVVIVLPGVAEEAPAVPGAAGDLPALPGASDGLSALPAAEAPVHPVSAAELPALPFAAAVAPVAAAESRSISSILSSIGGNRGKKRKPQDDAAGGSGPA